ncbi:hypothetical protein BHE74_00042923 [Ensete ventricosum]|nr:hypothetical protein BHE74_00042923 [Ensete ventricosum]
MGRPSSSRPTPSEQPRRHPRWRHVRANSADTLVSKVEPSVWHASPTIVARTINDAWRTLPLHHASAPIDSSYEVATPGVTKVIRPSVRMTYPRLDEVQREFVKLKEKIGESSRAGLRLSVRYRTNQSQPIFGSQPWNTTRKYRPVGAHCDISGPDGSLRHLRLFDVSGLSDNF